ncbi:uncharacterized protein [Aristolochia californica]|uniref:uncharacterized protein isoform X2 n=1 Tax=Aristolochia californica TaxID=171875 RepID=UPI0035DFE900
MESLASTACSCSFSPKHSSVPLRRAVVDLRSVDPPCERGDGANPQKCDLEQTAPESFRSSYSRLCMCGRRHFLGTSGAALLPISPVYANASSYSDPLVADYKTELFTHLTGEDKKVLELGIGTGPNLKYYARGKGVSVFGVDPNGQMAKYASAASVAAGLPPTRFNFIRGVAEALPVTDASMDAVIGTLVLCSVRDVPMALKEVKRVLKPGGLYFFLEHVAADDGTLLRFFQSVCDPLQQALSDGCHLTRETGRDISRTGFSELKINSVMLSKAFLISPLVYGVACK